MNSAFPRPPGQRMGQQAKPAVPVGQAGRQGFRPTDLQLLHDALRLAGMAWFDGDQCVLAKKDQLELLFTPGQSAHLRWAVMSFPIYNMNMPNAAEIALHFLAEAHGMIHVLDFQYQVGINMQSENLEFMMQLPLEGVVAAQLAELVRTFFDALSSSIQEELAQILDELGQLNGG
ncbi:hypothetical protein [Limnobacter sp.]|uniref:hypothetical protein n=1 Tax=Limnobacter sp. TaxID=2003368 RepID=UPI003518D7B6